MRIRYYVVQTSFCFFICSQFYGCISFVEIWVAYLYLSGCSCCQFRRVFIWNMYQYQGWFACLFPVRAFHLNAHITFPFRCSARPGSQLVSPSAHSQSRCHLLWKTASSPLDVGYIVLALFYFTGLSGHLAASRQMVLSPFSQKTVQLVTSNLVEIRWASNDKSVGRFLK